MAALLSRVRVRGFRTAHDVTFSPGALCALVGEANTGKSNLLLAVRALLDPGAPPFGADELAPGAERIEIDGTLTDGRHITLGERRSGPLALFFPSTLRSSLLVPPRTHGEELAHPAVEHLDRALGREAAPRLALIRCVETWCELRLEGLVILVEEPELYLRPQEQRYF